MKNKISNLANNHLFQKKIYISYLVPNEKNKKKKKGNKLLNINNSPKDKISNDRKRNEIIKSYINNNKKEGIIKNINKTQQNKKKSNNNNINKKNINNSSNNHSINNLNSPSVHKYNLKNLILQLDNDEKMVINFKQYFSPKIGDVDKIKLMENKIRRIRSSERFEKFINDKNKINGLKEQKTVLEEELKVLEKEVKEKKRKNYKNNLKIDKLDYELNEKHELSKNNSIDFRNIIKKEIIQMNRNINNTNEETNNIINNILYIKSEIDKISNQIQNQKNKNSKLINEKNDIIKEIDLMKKKIENIKGKINNYENLSNELLYDVDKYMNFFK